MPVIDWVNQQASHEWDKLRCRIPTASRFSEIITPKTMKPSTSRKKYACEIIAARLLNWQPKSLDTIEHIEDGKRNEPFAVAQLELIREVETKPVGLIRTDDLRFGASPDRVVMKGDNVQITVECKAPTIPVQFQYLLTAQLAAMEPPSTDVEVYRCQRQGQLYIAAADEAIFYSYHERTPPVYVRDNRDEPFIKKLADALERFDDEINELERVARSLGAYQAFAEFLPPTDIARDRNLETEILERQSFGG